MIDSEGFRPNVGIILSNSKGRVLWAKRIGQNAWQFPQGGIRVGETAEAALYRELNEELGLLPEHVTVLGGTRNWLRYRLPKRYIRQHNNPVMTLEEFFDCQNTGLVVSQNGQRYQRDYDFDCPECGGPGSIRSTKWKNDIHEKYRLCLDCGLRFFTIIRPGEEEILRPELEEEDFSPAAALLVDYHRCIMAVADEHKRAVLLEALENAKARITCKSP